MTNDSEIVLYQPDNSINMEVLLENETLWLTLDNLSMLYQRDKSTISRHIKNIFKEGELQPYAVVANFATTASDGKIYHVDYYNLDVIISVGYRVKSQKGVEFRKWANVIIKNHIIKANALNVRVDRVEEEVFYLKKKKACPETAKACPSRAGFPVWVWRRPTFPQANAVSSARRGLTSLFGMGRGGPPCYSHHVCLSVSTWL